MGIFSFLGVQSKAHIGFFTLFSRGKKIGTDRFGNTYYEGKPIKGYKRPRRWVMYKGAPEATKIPPEWHSWIHFLVENKPSNNIEKFSWQKSHRENLSGTKDAYRPDGSLSSNLKKNMKKYETWIP